MKKGFSLTEILVSIAIIGILSGIGIQAFVASRQRARLEEDVAKVVQALRKAQNSALAPSRSTAAGIVVDQKICSIVLKVDKDSKTITPYYTVVNNLGACTSVLDKNYGSPDNLNYSTIDTNINFIFETPDASTTEGILKLSIDDGSGRNLISKTIKVTNSGLIKVE